MVVVEVLLELVKVVVALVLLVNIKQGDFDFFSPMYCIQHCFVCRPSDSTVSENAGIEPRTVATSARAVRGSNHYTANPFGFI